MVCCVCKICLKFSFWLFYIFIVCRAAVDMVFMLDQSGSVGQYNHYRALDFIRDVVSFFSISHNATQVSPLT